MEMAFVSGQQQLQGSIVFLGKSRKVEPGTWQQRKGERPDNAGEMLGWSSGVPLTLNTGTNGLVSKS